ncbi:hypothetical protein HYV44_01385 [Candidatus Microgenomates bacterium]|nr:hypothetical protein [Candidatus Microgenomates bacterium]
MSQKDILSKLEQLHLSPNEAEAYLALLEIGQTSAGAIIKKTKLHRSVVYETLEKLIDKKLVFKLTKKKIAYFQTTAPTKILDHAKSQQRIAEKLLPQLKKMAKEGLPEINVYEGVEAYRQFWIDAYSNLPIGTVDYVAGSISKKWIDYMGGDQEIINRIRTKRKIKWVAICFEKNPVEVALMRSCPALNEYRLIKKNVGKYGNFNIFGDHTLILHSAVEPMIIKIKNKTLVKVFENIFSILWEIGKKF